MRKRGKETAMASDLRPRLAITDRLFCLVCLMSLAPLSVAVTRCLSCVEAMFGIQDQNETENDGMEEKQRIIVVSVS